MPTVTFSPSGDDSKTAVQLGDFVDLLEVLSLACPALTIRPGMAEVWHQVIGSTFHGFETLTVSMLKVAAKRAAQRSSLPSAADVVTEVRYLAQLDREYSEWTSETGADDASRADR